MRWTRTIRNTVATFALLLSAILVALLVVLPRLTGAIPLTVLSGSMEPTIPVGSVVFVQPIDPHDIRPGDVITFQAAPGSDELVTHRVIKVQRETVPLSFVTKGDANKGKDLDPTPMGAVHGRVWFHVPVIGAVGAFMHGGVGWGTLALCAGVLIAGAALTSLRRKPQAKVTSAAGLSQMESSDRS